MARLVVTANADADTSEILSYLAQKAGWFVAEDYGRRFEKAISRLAEMPATGAPRPGLGANTRVAIVYPYLLIFDYVCEDDSVTLLRILDGRRSITPDLLRR